MHPRLCSLAALLLLCLAACTSQPPQPTGSVQFAASTQQALSASDITRVKVTVSAAEMSSLVVELAKSNGAWGGLIGNIPTGAHRAFLAEAFDASGTKRFQGQTSGVTLTANQTTAVAITLQELAPPPPYANEVPVIDSLVASPTSVQTGGSISLSATVHDPNAGDTLSLAWTASGGTFSASSAATTSWTAPASVGFQHLTFTVTDAQGSAVSVSLTVNVVSGASSGHAALNLSFNLFPVVSRVSASLNRLDAGQSTSVSATASDADGDTLLYQWTATCPGTWTHATSSAASFVPSSVPSGACNNCQLTVTVQDGRGGQTTGSLNLCIASVSTTHFPPSFSNFYQSATSISPGQTVAFDVTALDPQSSSLTFAWTSNAGSLATAQDTAQTSRVVWTAPSCTETGDTPTVTATVTNAYGLSASKAFSLSGLPTCVRWSSAGFMAEARHVHTATLLPSGKVLIAGGYIPAGSRYIASAELYDPATHSWSSTAPMPVERGYHTATLLPSGKVLIVGGQNGIFPLATAVVYDPATHSWSSAAPMLSARASYTATLLPSGKVLVAGGYHRTAGALASAELYDPATNSWSSAAPMASTRHLHTATLLPSGKVLVAGAGVEGSALATAELYDPATDTWSSAGSLSTRRDLHTATLLPSGKVLIAGGPYANTVASAELYDPATNSWSSGGTLITRRSGYHTATLLPSGKVLLVAGTSVEGGALATAELYDPATNAWSSAGAMASARVAHTATWLNSGKVLFTGGLDRTNLSSAELYTP
ncbi:kelch repeat-containing protein [Stigmatella sp. ncwal1]|uniref:Kelch repeat-containing protein n=1 Tax=Stigmatella ashevillensis TaxID=2995309 RepID=A0ABT5D350_9BACT|nr:kelch repeat-containing protein [Stigmatella ashevillena]MDC0708105.1 kelch repeat-containing protein [Stigmatella ashevillena]